MFPLPIPLAATLDVVSNLTGRNGSSYSATPYLPPSALGPGQVPFCQAFGPSPGYSGSGVMGSLTNALSSTAGFLGGASQLAGAAGQMMGLVRNLFNGGVAPSFYASPAYSPMGVYNPGSPTLSALSNVLGQAAFTTQQFANGIGQMLTQLPPLGAGAYGAHSLGMPMTGMPAYGVPMGNMPTVGMPAVGMPVTGMPVAGMPMTGMPVAGMPVTGMPVTGMPVTGMPVTGMPVAGMPVAGMPVAGMPMAGMPVAGMPMTGMPMTGMPMGGMQMPGFPAANQWAANMMSDDSALQKLAQFFNSWQKVSMADIQALANNPTDPSLQAAAQRFLSNPSLFRGAATAHGSLSAGTISGGDFAAALQESHWGPEAQAAVATLAQYPGMFADHHGCFNRSALSSLAAGGQMPDGQIAPPALRAAASTIENTPGLFEMLDSARKIQKGSHHRIVDGFVNLKDIQVALGQMSNGQFGGPTQPMMPSGLSGPMAFASAGFGAFTNHLGASVAQLPQQFLASVRSVFDFNHGAGNANGI